MRDPYQVLGVSPTATDDEIKTAYRALARKYHPDKYHGSDLEDMANEKMKEINIAYDEIQKLRAGQYTGRAGMGGSAYGEQDRGDRPYGGGATAGGGQRYGGSVNPYIYVRQLLNAHRPEEARAVLDGIPENERGGEWHYLMGVVAARRGHYVDAQHFFDTACGLEPNNNEYRDAADRLRNGHTASFGSGRPVSRNTGCSCCDLCTLFLCANCLCGNRNGGCC